MGWLADRTSPRVPLLIAGVSIFAGGWLAASGGEFALYAGYVIPLGFLGNAATFTPAMNNIQGWFDRRRSIAVSIISVGPAISGFVWPQIYRWLLPDVGWRQSLVIYGVIAGTLLFLCAFYVRPAPVVHAPASARPRICRCLPMPSPVADGAPVGRRLLLLRAPWPCRSCTWWRSAVTSGFAAARGSEAISLILLTAVAATFAMGRLSDYIGPIKVSLLCAVIQIASLLGFVFVESLSGIYTLSVIHGIPYIAIVQGYALILRYLYGPAIAGWRLGVVMLFAMAGMAVGGWLGGAIFDATLSPTAPPSRQRSPSTS